MWKSLFIVTLFIYMNVTETLHAFGLQNLNRNGVHVHSVNTAHTVLNYMKSDTM